MQGPVNCFHLESAAYDPTLVPGETVVVEEYIEEPEADESDVQAYQGIDPDPPFEDEPDETWGQLGLVAGAVLVLAGVLFFVRKKFSKGQLPTPIQEVRLKSYI